jgi:hypothetical protein
MTLSHLATPVDASSQPNDTWCDLPLVCRSLRFARGSVMQFGQLAGGLQEPLLRQVPYRLRTLILVHQQIGHRVHREGRHHVVNCRRMVDGANPRPLDDM